MADAIRALARKCARSGLTLRDSQDLFRSLYEADCLRMAAGNRERAAEVAGVDRAAFIKSRQKREKRRAV